MAMQWWKCSSNVFDDEKILLLEATQKSKADTIILIWFRLLTLAAKLNNRGIFKFDNKPYPFDMLCNLLHKTSKKAQDDVILALNSLEQLGMITRTNGIIEITNWAKYQSQERYDDLAEKNRERQQRFREKQKQKSEKDPALQELLSQIGLKK